MYRVRDYIQDISAGAACCFYCRSKNVENTNGMFVNEHALRHMKCKDCDETWIDVFSLTDVDTED